MVFSGLDAFFESAEQIHFYEYLCGRVYCRACKKLRSLHAVACNEAWHLDDYQTVCDNQQLDNMLFLEIAIHHISVESNRFHRDIPINQCIRNFFMERI